MSNKVEGALFALVNSALTGRSADASQIKDAISGDGAKELYRLSKEHDLAHFVGCELEKLSLLSNDEISNKFRKQHYAAVFRYKGMEFAISEIKDALCEAKIPHIPLKGSVLRYEYPEPWMRTSCDIDILVKRTDIDRACEILAVIIYNRCPGDEIEVWVLWYVFVRKVGGLVTDTWKEGGAC